MVVYTKRIDVEELDKQMMFSRKLANKIGLHEAIIYNELVDDYVRIYDFLNDSCVEENYKANLRKVLDDDGRLFYSIQDLEQNTTLSKYQQAEAIDNLVELGLIKTGVVGNPPKRYFEFPKKGEYCD